MKKVLLFLILLSCSVFKAQNGFSTYTINNSGFTSFGWQTAFLIDHGGNKWLGYNSNSVNPQVGLAVYNVSTSTWACYNTTNTPTMPSNRVTSLTKDNIGNIWIGTVAGLVRYNSGNFSLYTIANGLPSNNILSLESINNMIYIGTDNGLSRFNGTVFSNYNPSNALLPVSNVYSIKAENMNTIWLGSTNTLVKFFINASFTSTSYTLSSPTFSFGNVNAIHVDADGNKWLGRFGWGSGLVNDGIAIYDNAAFKQFSKIYPNLHGAHYTNSCPDFARGPNNGVLFSTMSCTPALGCIVEVLPGLKRDNLYFAPSTLSGGIIGPQIETDLSNRIFVSRYNPPATNATNAPLLHSLNIYNYSPVNAGCGVTSANTNYLDINRVKAQVMNRGDMHWDVASTGLGRYEVPVGVNPVYGLHGSYATSLWIGGLDVSNQIHTAAQMYRISGNDFWPGPLDTINGGADTASFLNYDKIWKISYTDINDFITNFNNGNIAANTYTPSEDILTWPAHGTGNKSRNLAPFVDSNGDEIYNPYDGDYPKIKGDQALYFIFNDMFAPHSQTKGLPLGVEIHCMAYAYGCPNILNGRNELSYTTFYDYKIYNRSNINYHDVYIGYWTEGDNGYYGDDYLGSSINENLGFSYNSDGVDFGGGGPPGYDDYPPAAGTTVLKGPKSIMGDGLDNDNDGLTDEANEECLMSKFMHYTPIGWQFPNSNDPDSAHHYYNYLQGKWKNGTSLMCGGNGYGGSTPTNFSYPWSNYLGNPCGIWTESSAGNPGGDRKYIVSSGPFNLNAKEMTEVEYAYVWSVDSSVINNNIGSVNKLISDVQKIRSFYNGTIPNCLQSISIGFDEKIKNHSHINLYPNPTNGNVKITSDKIIERLEVKDIYGRDLFIRSKINTSQTEIDLSSLADGVYFINVSGKDWKNIRKVVKQ